MKPPSPTPSSSRHEPSGKRKGGRQLQSKIQTSKSKIECLLLTGGRSSRMGVDKAKLTVGGVAVAERIALGLAEAGYAVTVLGQEAVEGFGFQKDEAAFEGPLAALAGYEPSAEALFVISCDLPRFDPLVVEVLAQIAENAPEAEVVLPVIAGRRQPLCALFRKVAWRFLPGPMQEGRRSMMAWLDGLTVREVFEAEWEAAGIDPGSFRSANTPEDWAKLAP